MGLYPMFEVLPYQKLPSLVLTPVLAATVAAAPMVARLAVAVRCRRHTQHTLLQYPYM